MKCGALSVDLFQMFQTCKQCLICKCKGLLRSLGSNSLRPGSLCDYQRKPWLGPFSYLPVVPLGVAGTMQAAADPIMQRLHSACICMAPDQVCKAHADVMQVPEVITDYSCWLPCNKIGEKGSTAQPH